jgi:hypothetical protein
MMPEIEESMKNIFPHKFDEYRASLVLVAGNDFAYLSFATHLILQLRKLNKDVYLLDLSETVGNSADMYQRRVLKIFKKSDPSKLFKDWATSQGVKVIETDRSDFTSVELSAQNIEILGDSATSASYTFSRDTNLMRAKIYGCFQDQFDRGALSSKIVKHSLGKQDFAEIFIPNGRFPTQAGPAQVAQEHGVGVFFYERGNVPHRMYLQRFKPQDRIARFVQFQELLESNGRPEFLESGVRWLEDRRNPQSGAHAFGQLWNSSKELEKGGRPKKLTVFTSSQDEFLALGPSWHIHEWSSQWDAIKGITRIFLELDFEIEIRVHPNLATKSRLAFLDEIKEIEDFRTKYPSIKIHMHDSKANSYDLIEDSEVVAVWDSTIGLEAVAMGVPVISFAATYYDLCVHTLKYHSPKSKVDLAELNRPQEALKETALLFMGYLVLADQVLCSDISKLDFCHNNKGIAFAISSRLSGTPHPLMRIITYKDLLLNRRISSSLQIFKKKISTR